jgi:D-alanyl-D-alanine dipeptidase
MVLSVRLVFHFKWSVRLLFVLAFVHIACDTRSSVPDTLIVFNKEDYELAYLNDEKQRLVNLDSLPVNNIRFDIRYNTTNNFTGKVVYTHAAAYARVEVAEALKRVADSLKSLGMGLLIYDAYRPYSATVQFWELIGDERYVANPARGSRHNRGCAVDVSLYDLFDGNPLQMPTEYDDFSEKASAFADCELAAACRNRRVLQLVMTWAGFDIFDTEWWHFDFKGWEGYPILDVSFEDVMSF